ncbi:acyl-CoA thioesterase [Amycolatopsis sp. CA-230715]|uniref:acyl-CoA thioesterase n=1 Tax=Amycolatopsis sp. CA-230715 TaxID=2745196 RepID=UPI001C02E0DD|nr:thioesterase family protein [Amycolatopsis sp. CA-230715]QWF85490.1 Acyl-CoA thioesterase YbgC [Amycolatopsis sp. CA-230715]
MTGKPIAELPLRVRYHECDGQGIVFNAHYLAYADMASFEMIKTAVGSYDKMREDGFDVVVAEANLRYLAASRFDDELVVTARVEHVGTTSLLIEFEITRDGETVVVVKTRYVFVDTATLKPARPPAEIRDAFVAYAPPRD